MHTIPHESDRLPRAQAWGWALVAVIAMAATVHAVRSTQAAQPETPRIRGGTTAQTSLPAAGSANAASPVRNALPPPQPISALPTTVILSDVPAAGRDTPAKGRDQPGRGRDTPAAGRDRPASDVAQSAGGER